MPCKINDFPSIDDVEFDYSNITKLDAMIGDMCDIAWFLKGFRHTQGYPFTSQEDTLEKVIVTMKNARDAKKIQPK